MLHPILSVKFNQDPLENFFGKVRQSGGWSGNPSSKTVEDATNSIRLQRSSVMSEVPFPLSVLYCTSICLQVHVHVWSLTKYSNTSFKRTLAFYEATGLTNHTNEITICHPSKHVHKQPPYSHYLPVKVVKVYSSFKFQVAEKRQRQHP